MAINGRFALVLAFGWIAQAVIVPIIAFGTIQPDVVLIVICVFGLLSGPGSGALGGFVGGLIQDLLAPASVGIGALVKTLMGYFSGTIEQTLLGTNVFVPAAIIAGVSFASQLAYVSILFIAGEQVELVAYLSRTILPSAAYTGLLGLVSFPLLSRWLGAGTSNTVFD